MTETRPDLVMTGIERIAAERQRQLDLEGWDAAHDQGHGEELARAAATYATPDTSRAVIAAPVRDISGRGPSTYVRVPRLWPWAPEYWKPVPGDRIRELEKAGALIAAAIDSLLEGEDRG